MVLVETHIGERRHDVVAVLFVGRKQTVLDQEPEISETILNTGVAVSDVWRHACNDFNSIERNQLQSLPIAQIPNAGRVALRLLPDDVVSKLLLETGRRRRQRCNPMWLLGFRAIRALEPARRSAGLRESRRDGREARSQHERCPEHCRTVYDV